MWVFFLEETSQDEPPRIIDEEIPDIIDSILKDDDRNNDGYIDYPEFMLTQRR